MHIWQKSASVLERTIWRQHSKLKYKNIQMNNLLIIINQSFLKDLCVTDKVKQKWVIISVHTRWLIGVGLHWNTQLKVGESYAVKSLNIFLKTDLEMLRLQTCRHPLQTLCDSQSEMKDFRSIGRCLSCAVKMRLKYNSTSLFNINKYIWMVF